MTRLLRSLSVLALGVTLVACGGAQKKTEAPALPPANPEAVGQMVKGIQSAHEPDGTKKAIGYFEQALKTDNKLWEAHYNLGVLLASTGELARAESALAAAAKLAPNAEDVVVALAEVRRRRGDAGGAVDALEPFVRQNPEATVARTALVGALREEEKLDDAIEHARQVLVRRAGDPNALSELALTYLDRGEIDVAELLSQESLKGEQKSAVAERTAGLISLKKGDDAIAFQHFAQASELDPHDTTAQLNIGTVLLKAGVYDKASEHFRAVLQIEPEDVAAKIGLAASLRGLGKREQPGPWGEAEQLLKSVLEHESRNTSALYNLAVLYQDALQKPAEAAPLFKRFLDEAPTSHEKRAEVERSSPPNGSP